MSDDIADRSLSAGQKAFASNALAYFSTLYAAGACV